MPKIKKITVSDEAIVQALEAVETADGGTLPVYFGENVDPGTSNYNFIYYRPGQMERGSINTLKQTIFIYLVSQLDELETQVDLIDRCEGVGLKMEGAAKYDRYKLADTDDFINVVGFAFYRLIKVGCDA